MSDAPEDLFAHLSDAPLLTAEAQAFLDEINLLLDDADVAFAVSTLEGIRASVRGRGVVTAAQRQAVQNIADGARRGRHTRERGPSSRRYEGFTRG